MGKDLKGKELGIGISQRKDGLYTGRVTDRSGKRRQKYFKKLQECRQWVADAQFQIEHGTINALGDMTVDAWFDYWIENIKGETVSKGTLQSYKSSWGNYIKPCLSGMMLSEIKPLHCQNVLNVMQKRGCEPGTQRLAKQHLCTLLGDAVKNELILKNPASKNKMVVIKPKSAKKEKIFVLTAKQQKQFIECINGCITADVYLFVLQTGLRSSEVRGLKWDDVDFQSQSIHVTHNTLWDKDIKDFVDVPTKTENGLRRIPLTNEALRILKNIKDEQKVVRLEYKDYVFLNTVGRPHHRSVFRQCLKSVACQMGIDRLTMHMLRHTFATRCIETGMNPKTLQAILGHSDISMTMNLYVHSMEDYKTEEIKAFEERLSRIV